MRRSRMDETVTLVDEAAFEEVKEALANGEQLTFEMIGKIFGSEFWMMLVYTLMDSQDAARAIQGAVNRLRSEGITPGDDEENPASEL